MPAVSLWLYRFVTTLLSSALTLSGILYTKTHVTKVEETHNQTTLTISRGVLNARKSIFATNVYTAALLPQYEGVVTPCREKILIFHLCYHSSHHAFLITLTTNSLIKDTQVISTYDLILLTFLEGQIGLTNIRWIGLNGGTSTDKTTWANNPAAEHFIILLF